MKPVREFFVNTLVGGLLVVVPIYLAVLLLLKAMPVLVEFGVLLECCPAERAGPIAEKLCQTVREFRFVWDGRTFDIGASIGHKRATNASTMPARCASGSAASSRA